MYVLWMLVVLVGVSNTALVMRGEAAASDVAFPLYKLREVLGQAVTTPQGKEMGHIENVVLDAATGDLLYWVVTSGGGLGVGGTLRTLPWEVLQGVADRKAFQLQIEEEQFHNAPHFDQDRWPDMEDRHWVDAIHVYYGKPPRLGKPLGPDNEPVAQGPRPVLRAASVVQSTVMNTRGQRLGEIKDVVIDAAAGRHCQLNAKNLYISAVTRKLSLVSFFHDRLYFRHLYPIRFPHREGVCERFFIKLTMPGRERKRSDACQSPADRVQTFQHTGGQAALTAGESATHPGPAKESPREANRGRTHAWESLGGSSLD